jgi:hypothetical protein
MSGQVDRDSVAFFRDRESGPNLRDGLEFHAAGIVIKAHPKCASGKELAAYWHPFECQMRHEWRSFGEVECYDIPDWMLDDVKTKYEFHKYA